MQSRTIALIVCLTVALFVCQASPAEELSGAAAYLDIIKKAIAHTRADTPAISLSAEQASKYYIQGGTIWAGGSQAGFDAVANNRAGGLMSLRKLRSGTPAKGDVVLYAAPGKLNPQDLQAIRAWKSQDIYVVALASKPDHLEPASSPNALIDNHSLPGLTVNWQDRKS